jgi:hypothetical protein
MKKYHFAWLTLCAVLFPISTFGQVPDGWHKVSGPAETGAYSGIPDGLLPAGDRQNSYAWAMDVFDNYLYVGTNRNVFSLMVQQVPWGLGLIDDDGDGTEPVPLPTDMRARIYRLLLSGGTWEEVYRSPAVGTAPPIQGLDSGYRMMKTFAAEGKRPVLYAGGGGLGLCRLLAFDGSSAPTEVFRTEISNQFLSIRAIAEHAGQLCWATEDAAGPAVWCSPDPLREARASARPAFERVALPSKWLVNGGEIVDMISYNGWLHVFFFTKTTDPEKFGFWAAKTRKTRGEWKWELIVGDAPGARYAAGLGNPDNGVAVPFRYKNHVYVGTLDGAAFRLLNDISAGASAGMPLGTYGREIWRFDQSDRWERVMPSAALQGAQANAAAGFGNANNKYIWRFGRLEGRLYAGTFDVGTGQQVLNPPKATPPPIINPLGFDLYSTQDGLHWKLESEDGFRDRWNYGLRSFATDPATGDLYFGTANAFYGCQVWRKRAGSR